MKTKIKNKIRAGYPILCIDTLEETRTLHVINEIAKELNIPCRAWSLTAGMFDIENGNTIEQIDDTIEFIRHAAGYDDDCIFVMLDPHPFLGDPMFVRSLKDGIPEFSSGKRMILMGTGIEFPEQLKHLVETIHIPLPSKTDLEKVLLDIAEDIDDETKEKSVEALAGLTTDDAANAIAESIVETGKVDPAVIMREKCNRLSSRDFLKVEEKIPDVDDIGGLDILVSWLKQRKNSFSAKAREFGLPIPKGILMVGIPGCGKSLTAKAAAGILELPLIRFDVGALMGSLVGESERNTREAIAIAEAMAPCVLWIDELDKQLSPSGGTADGAHEVTRRVMSSILTWLQEKTSPVFIVATANNIQGIASAFPELLRKGRWDEMFFVDLPNRKEREAIFEIHIRKHGREIENIKGLADKAKDFTGAEIEACIRDAMFAAFDAGDDLSFDYITEAINKTIPQARSMSSIKQLREWAKGRTMPASTQETENNKRKIM